MNNFIRIIFISIFFSSNLFIYSQIPGLNENKNKLIEKRFSLHNTSVIQNSAKLKDKINGSVTKRSIGDFSLGAGAAFHYNFAVTEFLLSANLGFRFSKHFALVNCVEFVFWKTPKTNYYYNEDEGIRLLTGLYIAPSYYLQIKKFIFYAGGGVCGWLPALPYSLQLFLMSSTGYNISDDLLLKLSVRVPVYYGEKLVDMTTVVMYSILF